ncbi:SGNH hydrolase domain-containing protein [Streptomyces sp. NPDC093982]|uniref:SGNH hydrolase domain-containing protein n=1 Tax=Streptomyces sp. NPDC093982 TaxID=3155077 RepID=UPI00343CEEDF
MLVAGDSWAGYFGDGMIKVASKNNVIVNAGLGGCGIMLPNVIGGKKPNPSCLEWPEKWPEYMTKYRPDAVLMRTATWDMTPQSFGEYSVALTIEHPVFRKRFEKNMNHAIEILTKHGTPVYLTNTTIGTGVWRDLSLTMNREIARIANKYKGKGVYLLDLNAELCNDSGCPKAVDGHGVYDELAHPADWSRDRLAKWILNSMFSDSPAARNPDHQHS